MNTEQRVKLNSYSDKPKKNITAYAWASGLIEFGKKVPDGALPIIKGDEQHVRELIYVHARHSRTCNQLLVPGIPEANNQYDACTALMAFTKIINKE